MMTTDQSRKLIQEYAQALSQGKSEATLDKFIDDQELKGHIIIFEAGLPDYRLIPKDIIAEGNKVVIRATLEGEHKGELFGVPPTGKKVQVDGIVIYELANNKIVNHWMQFDTVALMQQIGAMAGVENNH